MLIERPTFRARAERGLAHQGREQARRLGAVARSQCHEARFGEINAPQETAPVDACG